MIQQAALLQVADQRRARLIDFACHLLERLAEIGVMVPIGVIELHEAHAALDQPAGQQAVVGVLGLPGSAPYISSVSFDSFPKSISSGPLDCIL